MSLRSCSFHQYILYNHRGSINTIFCFFTITPQPNFGERGIVITSAIHPSVKGFTLWNKHCNLLVCGHALLLICNQYLEVIETVNIVMLKLWYTCLGIPCEWVTKLQQISIRIISLSKYNAYTEQIFKELKLLKVYDILQLQELKFYYKYKNHNVPYYLQKMPLHHNSDTHNYETYTQQKYTIQKQNMNILKVYML